MRKYLSGLRQIISEMDCWIAFGFWCGLFNMAVSAALGRWLESVAWSSSVAACFVAACQFSMKNIRNEAIQEALKTGDLDAIRQVTEWPL
jgi:hypothetical protein